jgi:Methyltransferase domain
MRLGDFLVGQAKQHRPLAEFLTRVVREVSPEKVIVLDYPIDSRPRWSQEKPNQPLYDIINIHRAAYESHLKSFLSFTDDLLKIPERPADGTPSAEPFWVNGWLPALDGVALYSFIALNAPKYYVEVGSGNSTKFARRAINDHKLSTRIVSIDPCPRAEINDLCDRSIRKPLESVDLDVFDVLEANDILYIDNSHRVFMNSDATVVFLDVLPRLKPGVLVQIHDVTLPYDYPAEWTHRYYSEQYLLAAYILAKGSGFDIVMPSIFVSEDPELRKVLSPLWAATQLKNVQTHGSSFWLRTK